MSKTPTTKFQLIDNHQRQINYVRLSVTDRCNLRCFYCMPEKGMKFLPKKEILSFEEMVRLSQLLAELGITKIRITGGEPFVRNELVNFLETLTNIKGIEEVHLTTNGVLTGKYIPKLKEIGIKSVNLSLDTLDKQRFFDITRRDQFENVMETFHGLINAGIKTKINCVVIDGKNTMDIIPMVELARNHPVEIRFIEEMPFNGHGSNYSQLLWNHRKILEVISNEYKGIAKIKDEENSTSANYQIPGFIGNVGIIAAYSRTFCGSCNRLRITSQGVLQTCLYGLGVLNIKTLLRKESNNQLIKNAIINAVNHRAKDGFEAEKNRQQMPLKESMSVIGG